MQQSRKPGFFTMIGPGLLVAATGVGAGDLATASFAGSLLGNGILWAAVLGAFLKYVVNEGLARWQLATGSSGECSAGCFFPTCCSGHFLLRRP
jgi:Mn2+/Fe2+ NRAMP family transporter